MMYPLSGLKAVIVLYLECFNSSDSVIALVILSSSGLACAYVGDIRRARKYMHLLILCLS